MNTAPLTQFVTSELADQQTRRLVELIRFTRFLTVGAHYVIATGRPVLYMGGFSGNDNVVSADGLAQLVAEGELRFVKMSGGRGQKQDILSWLESSCTVVDEFGQQSVGGFRPQGQNPGGQVLYDCR